MGSSRNTPGIPPALPEALGAVGHKLLWAGLQTPSFAPRDGGDFVAVLCRAGSGTQWSSGVPAHSGYSIMLRVDLEHPLKLLAPGTGAGVASTCLPGTHRDTFGSGDGKWAAKKQSSIKNKPGVVLPSWRCNSLCWSHSWCVCSQPLLDPDSFGGNDLSRTVGLWLCLSPSQLGSNGS